MRIKNLLTGVFVIILVVANVYVLLQQVSFIEKPLFKDYKTASAKIGKVDYTLYIADNPEKRSQGLSNVEDMHKNHGMMFVFAKPDTYGFWMKNMNFSLDFVYLDGAKVVDLKESISPETFPESIEPNAPADVIIELNEGQIKRSGIQIGDSVIIK